MLKHLCKNKRELKDIIFKGFFLHKVENKQTNHTQKKEERKILLNYPITIPFRSHSQTAQPVFRTDPPLPTLKKKTQKKIIFLPTPGTPTWNSVMAVWKGQVESTPAQAMPVYALSNL